MSRNETLTSRERVLRTLRHEPVDRIPRHLWTLPGVRDKWPAELAAHYRDFPDDIAGPPFRYGPSLREAGVPCQPGEYTDAFGCIWHVGEPGVIGEVRQGPVATPDDAAAYALPHELLDGADFSQVDEFCRTTDRFVLAGTLVRPFERMQFLRGTEAFFMDLVDREPAVLDLMARLHELSLRELRLWCDTAVDAICFMDDWGSQQSLLIPPDLWREFFRPQYEAYCRMIRAAGKKVFFHSDGRIDAIYPDLVEIGVDALNSQLFCMDLEDLSARYGDRLTFWGEIDRQWILPFGDKDAVRAAVRRVAAATVGRRGPTGVIAQCEWGMDVEPDTIRTVFEAWDQVR